MRFRKWAAVAAAGVLAVLGTACSEDEVGSREDVVAMFVEEGLTDEMAGCLADATIDEFGLAMMNERRELTSEEEAKVEAMTTTCAGEVGVDNVVTDTSEPSLDDALEACGTIEDEAARTACEDGVAELEEMDAETGG